MQIRTKLFLVLGLTTATVVVATLAFTRWSIERGFVDFVENRQRERVERLTEQLGEVFSDEGTLQRLYDDNRAWARLLYGSRETGRERHDERRVRPESVGPEHRDPERTGRERLGQDRNGAHHEHSDRGPRGRRRLPRSALTVRPGEWPPERVVERFRRDNRPLTLELRTMLLDANGKIIRGNSSRLDRAARTPIQVNGTTIGYVALIPGPSLAEVGEIRFVKRQRLVAFTTAGVALLLSGIVALWLASKFTRPIATLQRTARDLADGNYAARAGLLRDDELGRLGADIDTLAQALALNERSRRQWVADVAHELRTPIAVMRAELEAIQDGVRQLDERAVRSLHSDVLRLSRLINDLHEVTVTDLGSMAFNFESVDVTQWLEDDVRALQDTFARTDLELSAELSAAQGISLSGDPGRLSQLIRNLLRNTLAYTTTPGLARLAAKVTDGGDGKALRVTLDDSAPGVPQSALTKLFDRLYRTDPSRSGGERGAGLGLTICRNIAVAHGGTLIAESSPLGGLRMVLTLPLNPRNAPDVT
jgi:two-component system sensor histidine kinase BaeS